MYPKDLNHNARYVRNMHTTVLRLVVLRVIK
jgi:hypothetical protein